MKKYGALLIAAFLALFLTACERDDTQPQVYNDNTTTTEQPANSTQPPATDVPAQPVAPEVEQPTVTPPVDNNAPTDVPVTTE